MARLAKSRPTITSGHRNSRTFFVYLFICWSLACSGRQAILSRIQNPQHLFESIEAEYKRGELVRARQDAETGYHRFQKQRESEWHWKFKLLYAEMLLWNADTNQADALLSEAPPSKYARLLARYRMLQGYVLFEREKNGPAEKLLQSVAIDADALADYELEADTELLLAGFLSDLSLERAQAAAQKALNVATAHGLDYERCAAFLDLGVVELRQGLYGHAIRYFESVHEIAQRTGASALDTFATDNLATSYSDIGDFEPALKLKLEVVSGFEKAPNLKTSLRDSYLELGKLYLLLKDLPRANDSFRKALREVNETDSPDSYAEIAGMLAQGLTSSGALEKAEYYNRKALAAGDKQDRGVFTLLFLNQAAIAEGRGKHQDAIDSYRRAIELGSADPSLLWQAYAGLGSTYERLGDVPRAKLNFEQALRVIEQNRSVQSLTDYKITFLSALIHFYQEYVALLISQNETERALEIADSSRASVLTEDVTRRTGAERGLVDRVRNRARLANSVFLFYWLAPRQSYLWVITAHGVKTIPLADERQIEQDVASYRYAVEEEKRDPLAESNPVGKRLYQTLVGPAADCIPRGSRIVIVPDGPLHNLNFETLIDADPVPHYWLEEVTISIEPSLSLLGSKTPPAKRPDSLLLFGDPEMAGTGYGKLPQAGTEMEKVQHHFRIGRSVVYAGQDASVDSYRRSRPERFSAIHFTTHAEANERRPLDSAIILSPRENAYRLYARDVMQIPLDADLVTISACRGAGARTLSGEGLVGFAWAFFQAGARNVVTSLWDVNDRSTADLMDRFYAGIESGKPYGESLREAKLAMLHNAYSKPYYWAPFQLYSRSVDGR